MKTYSAKPGEVARNWYVVDADGQTLGRMATEIARRLRGKHKPEFTPHIDTGDFVIVINAEKVKLTGNKWTQKNYDHHTGYVGGLKRIRADKMLDKDATRIITAAVNGMLPRGPLGNKMATKLKVYTGSEHPHTAQQPITLELGA
ncbi:MAG: 50S ribosomal protein L13 [Alphaproteobacteria bacterium CG_4_10_14_0_2_um_filter_63_37]|nr:MAG: 50S ribosomal protein L13 [Proteobacteria bacterium CG1_02_64_396]PJA25461.1 MAG: 50S ribosomal protein L13 [Alphaproteobacteria bacterium CG_4_10_14_0_2_um_filter_63_37]